MHNIQGEKTVIGIMLTDNSYIKRTESAITKDYFFSKDNADLFFEICELHKAHGTVDISMIKTLEFREVAQITSDISSTSAHAALIKEIKTNYQKRKLIQAMSDVKSVITDRYTDLEAIKCHILNIAKEIEIGDEKLHKDKLVDILVDTIDNIEKQYTQKEDVYKRWGMPWMDEKTGGLKPAVYILAARPGVGKSALALQLMCNVSLQGAKCAFFGLEMPNEQNMIRLISNIGDVDKNCLDNAKKMTDAEWIKMSKMGNIADKMDIRFYDKIFNIDKILLKCEELITSTGLDFVVIDYLQLIETSESYKSTNDKIGYISRQIKKFQQVNGIAVLALSQLNRETDRQEEPKLSNLRDSGSLEQDADSVMFLHPTNTGYEETPEHDIEVKLIIAKLRGSRGGLMKRIRFFGDRQRFVDCENVFVPKAEPIKTVKGKSEHKYSHRRTSRDD